ncbi:MAG: hypothetical protein R3E89_11870 [Thiolinea sp.]
MPSILTVFKIVGWVIFGLFVLLIFLILMAHIFDYIEQIRQQKKLRVFLEGTGIITPKVKISNSYGYKNYRVIFNSLTDMKNAESLGVFKIYRETIQNKHQGHGKEWGREFDANLGVTFTFNPE